MQSWNFPPDICKAGWRKYEEEYAILVDVAYKITVFKI